MSEHSPPNADRASDDATRDARLDALWRATRRELPPAALDAALAAAARREVGVRQAAAASPRRLPAELITGPDAGPARSPAATSALAPRDADAGVAAARARPSPVNTETKPRRRTPAWWPLAAAATVAAVAVGIVELTPPETVSVSDRSPVANRAQESVAVAPHKSQQGSGASPAPRVVDTTPALPPSALPSREEGTERRRVDNGTERKTASGRDEGASSPATKIPPRAATGAAARTRIAEPPTRSALSGGAALRAEREAPVIPRGIANAPGSPPGATSAPPTTQAPTFALPNGASVPPAAPLASPRQKKLQPKPDDQHAAIASPPQPSPATVLDQAQRANAAPARPQAFPDETILPTNSEGEVARRPGTPAGAIRANAAPSPEASHDGSSSSLPARSNGAADSRSTRSESVADAAATPAAPVAANAARGSDPAPRPPGEWIGAIRKLLAEQRNAEATEELRKFRTAYGADAERLLPADLRALKPR